VQGKLTSLRRRAVRARRVSHRAERKHRAELHRPLDTDKARRIIEKYLKGTAS
jgi:hypothetical protein